MKKYLTNQRLNLMALLAFSCAPMELKAQSPLPVPDDFMVQGKPIEAECLKFNGESPFEPILLKEHNCQTKEKPLDQKKLKEGFLGYSSPNGTYIFYKHLGPIFLNDLEDPVYDLIFVKESPDGEEQHTSLLVVKKTDSKLRLIDVVEEGDRCNGGLSDIEFKEGTLTYKVNLTPWSLFSFTQDEDVESVDFPDCPSCCIGKLSYEDGDITHFAFENDVLKKLEGMLETSACYQKVVKESMDAGKKTLNLEELLNFGESLKKQCVDSASSASS